VDLRWLNRKTEWSGLLGQGGLINSDPIYIAQLAERLADNRKHNGSLPFTTTGFHLSRDGRKAMPRSAKPLMKIIRLFESGSRVQQYFRW
jgi:hypothetical protein